MNRFVKRMTRPANGQPQTVATTVTFLEMTKRPNDHVRLPMNAGAALLQTLQPPLHFYRYLYYHVGIHWTWESRLRLDDEALSAIIHADTTDIRVLYLDGAPAGFFEIDISDPARTNLAYFGMMPHTQGRGLGRWFLSAAIHACWENDPEKITVNTCTLDHPAALPLYQKMGFTPVRQKSGQILPLEASEVSHALTSTNWRSGDL